jgi:two-component system, LytTR family, response regulator
MNCIIVDDEPLAQDILESYIEKIPDLCLAAKCKNAYEAAAALQEHKIDLMFLDIEMPDITGTQFLAGLAEKPMVVFTTAYPNYAIEGFELNALDYLLKPISPDRFLKSVQKAKDTHKQKNPAPKQDEPTYIFVKAEYQTVKIQLHDIMYIEGLKDYVKIYTRSQGMIMTLMNLKGIHSRLPQNEFIRVHRSFIVPLSSIEKIDRSRIVIKDKRIPIGESYKDEFNKLITF